VPSLIAKALRCELIAWSVAVGVLPVHFPRNLHKPCATVCQYGSTGRRHETSVERDRCTFSAQAVSAVQVHIFNTVFLKVRKTGLVKSPQPGRRV